MIVAFFAFAAVAALLIVSTISIIQHTQVWSLDHLRLDITFFVISLLSTIVMVHIIIKNRHEIKGLIFEDD
jgi:hypothetical protein